MLAVAFAALYLIIEKKLNPRDAAPDYGEGGDRAAVYEEAEDEQLRDDRYLAPLCCEAVLEDATLKEVSQRCVESPRPRDAEVVLLTYLPRASLDTYGKYALSIMGGYALTHGHRLERYTGLVPKDKRHPEYHRVLIMWKVRDAVVVVRKPAAASGEPPPFLQFGEGERRWGFDDMEWGNAVDEVGDEGTGSHTAQIRTVDGRRRRAGGFRGICSPALEGGAGIAVMVQGLHPTPHRSCCRSRGRGHKACRTAPV